MTDSCYISLKPFSADMVSSFLLHVYVSRYMWQGVSCENPLVLFDFVFKHIFGRLQCVQWPSLSSLCLLRSQDKVFIFLIQTTFSGIRPKAFCCAHTHALPPAKVYFPAIKLGMDSRRLIDDKAHL